MMMANSYFFKLIHISEIISNIIEEATIEVI